jgi:hypothetical protein
MHLLFFAHFYWYGVDSTGEGDRLYKYTIKDGGEVSVETDFFAWLEKERKLIAEDYRADAVVRNCRIIGKGY